MALRRQWIGGVYTISETHFRNAGFDRSTKYFHHEEATSFDINGHYANTLGCLTETATYSTDRVGPMERGHLLPALQLSRIALSVMSALRSFETGQPILATSASLAKVA